MDQGVTGSGGNGSDSTGLCITCICDEAALLLATFSELIHAALHALDTIGSTHHGANAPRWRVGDVLVGFSETTDHQRIAIELTAPVAGREVADCLLAGLQLLRTTPELPDGFSAAALDAVWQLARTLHHGVSELWLSRAGETPAFVTGSTLENVATVLG